MSILQKIPPRRADSRKGLFILLAALFLLPLKLQAALEADEVLQDRNLETRAQALGAELRCPVCGGQSINDSLTQQARYLRLLIRDQLQKGKPEDEIKKALCSAYGENILLKPVFNKINLVLWSLPFLGFSLGVLIFLRKTWR